MKKILKIISLTVAIVAGIYSVLCIFSAYMFYEDYQRLISVSGEYVFNSNKNMGHSIMLSIIAICISIVATFTFRYLHKNKPKNEDNPTILDYDQTNNQ